MTDFVWLLKSIVDLLSHSNTIHNEVIHSILEQLGDVSLHVILEHLDLPLSAEGFMKLCHLSNHSESPSMFPSGRVKELQVYQSMNGQFSCLKSVHLDFGYHDFMGQILNLISRMFAEHHPSQPCILLGWFKRWTLQTAQTAQAPYLICSHYGRWGCQRLYQCANSLSHPARLANSRAQPWVYQCLLDDLSGRLSVHACSIRMCNLRVNS